MRIITATELKSSNNHNGWFLYRGSTFSSKEFILIMNSDFIFLTNGSVHNPSGPALISQTLDSEMRKIDHYLYGIKHRVDGPSSFYAKVSWVENEPVFSDIISPEYYLNGKTYFKNEFESHPEVIRYHKKCEMKHLFQNFA